MSLAPQLEWRRLSARMLLIHPVREVGRFIPAIAGLLIAGRTTGFGPWWGLVGVVLVIALSIARWYTTRYRITPTQVELRTGLLNRKTVVVPADRVRTVDVTAPVLHRLLGLAKVDIGTGGGGRGETAFRRPAAFVPTRALDRRVVQKRLVSGATVRVVGGCPAGTRLLGSSHAYAFGTETEPGLTLLRAVTVRRVVTGRRVVATATVAPSVPLRVPVALQLHSLCSKGTR